MQNINSPLINSNLALHFVLGTYHILLRNMTLQKQWVSWPFLHIKHSFSCRFLHNSHSKRWPGISSLRFLGSSSKFSWRRSNPQISVLSSRPCWEEVATSLKRDYKAFFPALFKDAIFEDKGKSVLGPFFTQDIDTYSAPSMFRIQMNNVQKVHLWNPVMSILTISAALMGLYKELLSSYRINKVN